MQPRSMIKIFALLMVISPSPGCEKSQATKGDTKTEDGQAAPSNTRVWAGNINQQATEIGVSVQKLASSDYKEFAEFFAEVGTIREVTLNAPAGGRVTSMRVDEGSRVTSGQALCAIDLELLENRLETAKLQERMSSDAYQRNLKHTEAGTISAVQLDRSKLEWLQAQSQRQTAEKQLEGAKCVTPIAGTIIQRHVSLHDDVKPGAGTLTIANLSKVKLTIGIPESEIALYKSGAPVHVTLDAFPGESWKGQIDKISQTVNTRNRTLDLDVHVENSDGKLKPGLTVRARILKYDLKNQIVVPNDAILAQGDRRVVMVSDGTAARMKEIQVKSTNSTHSLIAKGLEAGDGLIVRGQSQVVDGAPIRILEER